MQPTPRILIIGGGLAGMAAAVALESAGVSVTLIESSRRLGGRAGSFTDPETREDLDNCQHVLLGCCTNLLDFYNRLGVRDRIRCHRVVHFLDANGRQYDLRGIAGWPAPFHLGPSTLRFAALTVRERCEVARAMTAMFRLGPAGRDALGDVAFGRWLSEHHQSPGVIRKFYDPLLIGALNEETVRASAKYAIQVFQESLLYNAAGYPIGLPACPLGRLYDALPCRDVRFGARLASFQLAGRAIAGAELHTGELLTADAYILATNHHALARFIPPDLAQLDSRFAALDKLEAVPILGAHLWFDRPVMPHSHAALLDAHPTQAPLQWLFRKDAEGRQILGVISAARNVAPKDRRVGVLAHHSSPAGEHPTASPAPAAWKATLLAQFTAQIRQLFPAARDAKLLRGVIILEKRATFSPLPGVDHLRPAQSPPTGGIPNLFLAGDYTQTHWPATMEGAVRSGYLAASAALHRLRPTSPPQTFLAPDLPQEWPARLLTGV